MPRTLLPPGLVLALFLAGTVSRADAQTFFIDGQAFAGIERRSHSEVSGVNVGQPDLNGTVAGGGVTLGSWLTPHVSVRLEVSYPGSVAFSYQPSDTLVGVSPALAFSQRIEGSERLRSASALVAYHTGRTHHVQLAYIGGAAFLFVTQRQKLTRSQPVFPLTVPVGRLETSIESTTNLYNVTAEAGLDADIELTSRFSVVPQLRIIGFGGGVSIRPGVALRAGW
jgi:hypothetical protein